MIYDNEGMFCSDLAKIVCGIPENISHMHFGQKVLLVPDKKQTNKEQAYFKIVHSLLYAEIDRQFS